MKFWSGLEASGVAIPSGERLEEGIEYSDGALAFRGSIAVDIRDVSASLAVTRIADGAVIITENASYPRLESAVHAVADGSEQEVIVQLIQRIEGDELAARAFGRFDDRYAGVDVFAAGGTLDRLELEIPYQ